MHRSVLRASTATAGDVITTLDDLPELVSQAARGDPAAWEEIMRRYSGLVAAKIRTFRLQDADTLDAMQITWLRLAENIHRIRHPERLGGWLATTAARECIHILRHAKRTQHLTDVMVNTLADADYYEHYSPINPPPMPSCPAPLVCRLAALAPPAAVRCASSGKCSMITSCAYPPSHETAAHIC